MYAYYNYCEIKHCQYTGTHLNPKSCSAGKIKMVCSALLPHSLHASISGSFCIQCIRMYVRFVSNNPLGSWSGANTERKLICAYGTLRQQTSQILIPTCLCVQKAHTALNGTLLHISNVNFEHELQYMFWLFTFRFKIRQKIWVDGVWAREEETGVKVRDCF